MKGFAQGQGEGEGSGEAREEKGIEHITNEERETNLPQIKGR